MQNNNFELISKRFETSSHLNEVLQTNALTLWRLSEEIEAPSLAFRIVRIFLHCCSLTEGIRNWYLNQVASVVVQHNVRFIRESRATISEPSLQANAVFNQELNVRNFRLIKMICYLNRTITYFRNHSPYSEEVLNTVLNKFMHEFLIVAREEPDHLIDQLITHCESEEKWQQNKLVIEQERKEAFDIDETEQNTRKGYVDFLTLLKEQFAKSLDEETSSAIDRMVVLIKNYPKHSGKMHTALQHIQKVVTTINDSKFSPEEANIVLRTLFRMTSLGIRQGTLTEYIALRSITGSNKKYSPLLPDARKIEIDKLQKKCPKASSLHAPQSENKYICVIRNDLNQSIAKVRFRNSRPKGGLPEKPRTRELLAYEMSEALGIDNIPTTIIGPFGDLYQKFIPNVKNLQTELSENIDIAAKLKSHSTVDLQLHLTFDLIRSAKDARCANIIFQQQSNGLKLHVVDSEADFFNQKKLQSNFELNTNETSFDAPVLSLMGLPQATTLYSKATLQLFLYNDLKIALNRLAKARKLDEKSIKAFDARFEMIQELFRFEMDRPQPTLTPQSLFFILFGMECFYHQTRGFGFTSFDFFNFIINHGETTFLSQNPIEGLKLFQKDAIWKHFQSEYTKPKELDAWDIKNDFYPGKSLLAKIKTHFSQDPVSTFDVLRINPECFDEVSWRAYQKKCTELKKRPNNCILIHLLDGLPYARQMARNLNILYPNCVLDIVQKENFYWLQMRT